MNEPERWTREDTEAVMNECRALDESAESVRRRREEAIADGLDPDLAEEMWQRFMSAPETIEALRDFLELNASGEVPRDDVMLGTERRTRPVIRRVARSMLQENGEGDVP
jgi:hypothetical protein